MELIRLNQKIHSTVNTLKIKYNTSDPFELIDYLDFEYFNTSLGSRLGCYFMIQRSKCIFLNNSIENQYMRRIIAAHELGHAILHPNINCYFIKNYTLYSTHAFEIEANTFAAELLISDDINKYNGYTIEQIAAFENVIPELVKLKI